MSPPVLAMKVAFSNKVQEVMERVLRRYAQSLQSTRRFDVRSKVSKEELTVLFERSYLVRANSNEQELLPGLMAFEDFADSFVRDLAKSSADAVLRALKLLYSDDQNKGWSEEDIRTVCREQLRVFEEEKTQIGMHLVHELRLGNSQFEGNRYTHVFPLEDILDFQSIDQVWSSQVESNRQSPTFRNLAIAVGVQSSDLAIRSQNHGPSSEEDLLDDLLPLKRRKAFDKDSSPANLTPRAPVALLVIDLDRFKQINDTLGHQTGDRVLIGCAEVLQSAVGGKGKVYRYGGEELAAILPNFTLSEARATAERIREQVSQLSVEGCDRQITVSIGVAAFPDCAAAEKLVECADKALYRAKNEGRNRVISAGDVSPKESSSPTATVALRPEDRIAAVDLQLRIDQGIKQDFMITISNKSDEQVDLTKIKITCKDVLVVQHEPAGSKTIQPRKSSAFNWACNIDPHQKLRQITGIWDGDFEVFIDVQIFAIVLGSLKVCKHSIKVKVEPGSYRIWELP